MTPGGDNIQTLGWSSARWSVIFSGTGTINTSDAREKTWRGAPTVEEIAVARRIVDELGFFQWNDAIAVKGAEDARLHFGVRAQRSEEGRVGKEGVRTGRSRGWP